MNSKKRLVIILLILALLIGCAYVLYQQMAGKVEVPQLSVSETTSETAITDEQGNEIPKAPDFIVLDAEDNQLSFYDYLGKPIVLNFWASWCGPCQYEMPYFEEVYKEYGDKVNFVMVNMTDGYRETLDQARKYIAEQGYTFPVFYDTEYQAAYAYGVSSLPTTYFIDSEGYGVAGVKGSIDADTLRKGIGMILSEDNG